jgi:hypothetical protein
MKVRTLAAAGFPEPKGKSLTLAFVLGSAVIIGSIVVGRGQAISLVILGLSFLATLLWRKAPRPWIALVSIVAATPIVVFRQQYAPNLLFAVWLAVFNARYLSGIPKWLWVPLGFAITGFATSMPLWLTGSLTGKGSMVQESAFLFSFILAPFLMLPLIYFRLQGSRDSEANLRSMLFFLIVPSTLILLATKLFGAQANVWEASLHVQGLAEGYTVYQLGKVIIQFGRTAVGFILAALICASTAITISRVKKPYRWLAGGCLLVNSYFLLITASFGSMSACICGLIAVFYAQARAVRVTRTLLSVIALVCTVSLIYVLLPSSGKQYVGKRYETRVTNADADRLYLWQAGFHSLLRHPGGVGFTLEIGGEGSPISTFIHNDYLAYAVSYGFIGGLAYPCLVLGLLISFFRKPKKAIQDPYALAVYLAGLGVIVALALNSMTDHMGVDRWYYNVIWSLVWYSYFCSRGVPGEARQRQGNRSQTAGSAVPSKIRRQSLQVLGQEAHGC